MKLFYNAKIYAMNDKNEQWNAFLVHNGKIIKTFNDTPQFSPAWTCIDLQKQFVLPGFTDAHTHSFEGGLYSLGCNLKPCKNLSEVLAKLKETKPIGNQIFAFQFDENLIPEKRFPTMKELDKISPNLPILLRRIDGHSCAINTVALEKIPWKKKFSPNFDGVLRKEENDIAAHWFHKSVSKEGVFSAYKAAEKIALKNGHTSIHTMIGDAQQNPLHFQFFDKIKHNFSLDWITYPQVLSIEKAKAFGVTRVGGCILADGSIGSHTAALFEKYSNLNTRGICYQTDDFWNKFVWNAHQNNLQVAIHAIGDRAIHQIVKAYTSAQQKAPKDLRHQVIHGELIQDKTLQLMAKNNITATMQPMFDRLWGGKGNFYDTTLGTARMQNMNRFKTMTEKGIKIGGSSDWYITDVDAKQGIHALENHHTKEEQLSRFQALKLYTTTAAYISHDEHIKGTLEEDKTADFIVTKNDPMTIPSFLSLEIQQVYKNAKCVFQNE